MAEEMLSLQDELKKIKEIEFEQPNEALQRYGVLLEAETEEKGEVFYRFGCFLHAFAEEEMALDLLVQAYREGVYQKEILDLLLQDFWEPNKKEFREAYLCQTGELLSVQRRLTIPDFDTLPYFMFPISGNQVMVYDRRKDQFLGWLDTGAALERERLKEPEAFFPVILDMENSSLQKLLGYFYQNKERKLYVLEQEAEWTGLLMLPDIWKEMSSIVLLQGMDGAKTYFQENMCRLPEIVRVKEEALASEIRKSLEEEHERRLREMGKERPKPLLTIGIPSWNRGRRARRLVEELCKLPYDVDLEILVSNNGSDKEAEEYEAIRDMQDARVSYIEFEENKMYYGNIAQVCRKASGSWVMLLSDEDTVDAKLLQDYMVKLEQFQETVSVIRPGSTKNYRNMKEEYQKAGEDALTAYGTNNTYVSGTTYNRKFMTGELVDKIEKAWIDHYAYQIYAHIIFDWYMCLKGDFYRHAPVLVLEGEAENAGEHENMIYEYNKFDNRMRQFNSYLEIINNMEETRDIEKVILFVTVCVRTIILLCILKETYSKEFGSWEICQKKTLEQINTGWAKLNIPLEAHKQYEGYVTENIQSVINRFGF